MVSTALRVTSLATATANQRQTTLNELVTEPLSSFVSGTPEEGVSSEVTFTITPDTLPPGLIANLIKSEHQVYRYEKENLVAFTPKTD